MNTQLTFLAFVLCSLICNTSLLAQSISGSIASCEGKCLLYTVSGGTAPYTWTVTGGSPASFVGASLNICWAAVGTGNIAISDALGSPATLSVSINPKPTPNIVPPLVPACPANNSGAVGTDNHSNNCQKACANSCATYYAPFTAGSNYVWTAGGNTSLSASGLGNSQVNVCWGNVGNGWLKVVETNAFGCVDSTKICINKIPTPTASFTPSPTISVCQGQSVSFNNTSTGAVAYQWTFGGGTPASSTQTHPTVVFNTPGTYTISLVAQNECLCSDTATATITVMSGNGPPIDCISALCAGSGNVPYSTTAGCGPYIWSISGGTIVSGAGTANITVNWGFTPPFTLSLQAGGCGYCPMPTTVSVPIIPLNMPIVGNTTACYGDIATYSLLGNTCGGSYHTWNIDPSLGYIISGQGSPTILVQWYNQTICTPQNTTVGVMYDNCYLACEHGTGSLNVNLAQQFIAEGPAEGCVNSASLFKAGCVVGFPSFSPTLCNWTIITPSNVTIPNVAINTPNLNYVWASGAGTYTVIATPVNPAVWCNASYSTTIDIAALPPAPTSIVGPLTICPNGTYTYQATASPFVGLFNWSATNGSIVPVNGNTVNVTWAALGPYSLSVTQQAINSPNCTSLPYTVSVNPYVAAPPTGLATVCLGQTTTYSVPAIPSSNYVWSISPAGAGAFLSATTGNSVTVQWNLAGAATISVAVCGQTSTKNITVNGTSSISIAPISYCAGGSGVLMAPASVCAPYVWKNAANVTISTGPAATVTAPGYYSLSATNCITGCAAIGTVLVTQNPVPVAAISTPDPTAYCGTAGINTTLYAQNNAGYSFQWYQGITPVGVNAPTHNVTAAGTYSVVVTNSFGCTASSNVINITYTVTCPSGPCSPVGTVMGMAMPTAQCNVWNFNGTATSATITGWNYGDGFSGANPSAHTYTQAGYYTATINAVDINGCLISATRLVTVPVAPNFNYVAACNRLVTFNGGLSTFVSPFSITNYSWDFGDPASGGANVATGAAPVHTFVGAGTAFNVTLTVTSSSGCTASIILPVNVYPQATAVIAPPASVCAGTGVSFNGSGSLGTLVGYAWDFGDPASGAANASTLVSPSHSYVAGGTYTVTLTVTDIYGCTASSSASVVVFSNTLGGTIAVTPAATVCLGTSVTLTAPNAGNSYVWSNGQTTQSITTNTSGTYSVTISNANGCQYITAQTVTVYPAPAAVIEGPTELCEGDAATLKVSPCNPSYTYNWSNAVSGCTNQVSYTWSPLPVGTHVFTVTVTDSSAPNCSVVLSHTLVVYPLPAAFSISSVPSGSLCEGTTVVFSAPTNPSVTYFWNTGQSGAVITVPNAAAGAYYAVAVDNVTGCERKSNMIYVHPLPDVCMAPQGCYTAVCCDTLCVPLDPNITAYQWYFNNIPIVGAINNTFVTCYDTLGTGVYQVLLTNVWGCSALSPPLNLTILPCDTSACAFVMQDTIRCQQTTVGVTYQYGFNLFNNSGFTVNSVQLVGITSTGVLPTVSPNPLSVAPILNNTSGAVQWFTFGGAGVAAGDTVCFQVNVAKLIGGVMDSCCTSPITHCVVIPSCCNCDLEGFQAQVNQGFTVVPTGTCGQYILTPQALGACDSVEWLISPPLYSVGNVPVVVTLPTGTHYVCMLVKRYDANGNLCAVMEKCITIVVPPCCVCDTHFYNQVQLGFSMSMVGYSGTFVPLGVFNNNCDVVSWSYTNGFMSVIMGSSVGSNPFVYNFPTAGFYTVYMCVTRTQADGTTCQYCVCRKLWIPPIIISDDDVDVLSLSVSQIIIAPHWHGCNTGWQDVQIDLLSGTQHGTVSFDAATGGFTYNASDGFVGTDVFSYLLCVNNGQETAPCDTVVVQLAVDASNPVVVHLRGMLSGAYDVNLSAMRTTLVAEHILPIVQPYNCAPWFYTGTEHFADITAVPANVVDYVFVEARAATDPNVLIERKVAVVLNNGVVTDHLFVGSGASDAGVHFDNLSPTGMYYFVLRHRNHLAVITAAPQAVGLSSAMINLSNPANVLGGAAQLAQIGGMYGLKAGDMNGNGVITVSDYNAFVLDVSDIGVYSNGDCNLDGNVITNDFNLFAPNSSAIAPSLIRY